MESLVALQGVVVHTYNLSAREADRRINGALWLAQTSEMMGVPEDTELVLQTPHAYKYLHTLE